MAKQIDIEDLVAHRKSVVSAYTNVTEKGRPSKSTGPISVVPVDGEPGKYQLADGYHRLIDLMFRGQSSIGVEVDKSQTSRDYYEIADPADRMPFDRKEKYLGLEDYADLEILDEEAEELYPDSSFARKVEEINKAGSPEFPPPKKPKTPLPPKPPTRPDPVTSPVSGGPGKPTTKPGLKRGAKGGLYYELPGGRRIYVKKKR